LDRKTFNAGWSCKIIRGMWSNLQALY